jgi:predicted ATPase/Tfp pilus assembly protein PilF
MTANVSETPIRTPDQRLRVFISSTMKELAAERAAARDAIARLRLTPVLFETGARPHPPRELYRSYLSQSDLFIGIYCSEYGWVGPGMEISGLEDESLLAANKPRLVYVKAAGQRDPRLQEMLGRIAAEGSVSYHRFSTAEQLRDLIENDLAVLLSERFAQFSPADSGRIRELPASMTPIIGREREIKAVAGLLAGEAPRLVTLTGPGGIGKTRLALAVAERERESFANGVAFVPLAGVSDHSLVTSTIAADLGAHDPGNRPLLEVLTAHLSDKNLLMLIDNFEQVVNAAPVVSDLLAAAPGLKVLVTSRRPLRLYGESEFPVSPLAVSADSSGRVEEAAAVQLFVRRAAWARPGFSMTPENSGVIAEICRRLDGIPLAIELAAAWLRVLSPEALLNRLSNRLDVLSGGARDLPERQQTLRGTIAWSYELLEDWEKDLFAQASIFTGGFDVVAVDAVCDTERLPQRDTLSALGSLVEHGLVQLAGDVADEPRFRMLETIREYALEQLSASGRESELRTKQVRYLARVVNEAGESYNVGGESWMHSLEREQDNLRAALDWVISAKERPDDPEQPLLDIPVAFFWYLRGQLTEGRAWADRMRERAERTGDDRDLANALTTSGSFAIWQSDLSTAREQLERSVALWREIGREERLALALMILGVTAVNQADAETAQDALEEALPIFQAKGMDRNISIVLMHLGNAAAQREELDLATRRFEEGLAIARGRDDTWMLGSLLNNLGEVARCQDDHARAQGYYEECRDLFEKQHAAGDAARARHNLAYCALRDGRVGEARATFLSVLEEFERIGTDRGIAECLIGLGTVAAETGEAERGARLLGAGGALLQSLGTQSWPADAREWQRTEETLRLALGAAAYDQLQREGGAMAREQAVAFGRAEASSSTLSETKK